MATREERIKKIIEMAREDLKKHRYHTALASLEEIYEAENDNSEIHYYLGIANARLGRYKRAAFFLDKVINSDLSFLNRIHARMILGYIHTILENYEEALRHFSEVVKAGFESAQAYSAIGYLKYKLGNTKDAIMTLYRAIELDDNNANAHNSLGYILAETEINLEEAYEECKKALRLDRNNPAYLDSLGWVCYKMGKLTEAKELIRSAYEKAPDNDEIKYHYNVVFKKI